MVIKWLARKHGNPSLRMRIRVQIGNIVDNARRCQIQRRKIAAEAAIALVKMAARSIVGADAQVVRSPTTERTVPVTINVLVMWLQRLSSVRLVTRPIQWLAHTQDHQSPFRPRPLSQRQMLLRSHRHSHTLNSKKETPLTRKM